MVVLLDNKVHNALLNWLRSHRVKAFAVKFDGDKKEIQVYTNQPGILIGKQGASVEKVQKEINQCRWYEDYKIVIIEIDTIISSDEFEISDEEYDRAYQNYLRSFDVETCQK